MINDDFIGDYSYNKTIKFKVVPKEDYSFLNLESLDDSEDIISEVIDLGNKLSYLFENLIYINNIGKKLTNFVSVKKQWLKIYFKDNYYISNLKENKISISKLRYIVEVINNWFVNWSDCLSKLSMFNYSGENSKLRHSDISSIFLKLNSKYYFRIIKDFCEYADHKHNSKSIDDLKIVADKLEIILNKGLQKYLLFENNGLEILRASMNYYAINKKPKDNKEYLDLLKDDYELLYLVCENLKNYKSKMKSTLFKLIDQGLNKDEILLELDKISSNFSEIPLKRDKSKEYSSELHKINYDYLNKDVDKYLFNDDLLDKVIVLRKRILELNKIENKSSSTKNEITRLKNKIGFYFIRNHHYKKYYDSEFKRTINNKDKFDLCLFKWVKFCDKYKLVKQALGRCKAQIKGIEKEIIESQDLKFWVLIFENKYKNKKLWLIPKEKMAEFNRNLLNTSKEGDCKLFKLNSLTMRSLNKLCFSQESTFVKNIPYELKKFQIDIQKATNDLNKIKGLKIRVKKEGKFEDLKTKDELKLPFFKKLLNSDYAKNLLDLKYFDLESVFSSSNLKEFEELLELNCYKFEEISIDEESAKNLISNYNIAVFDITSYDLENRNKNTYQSKESDYKNHTQIWNKFWSGDKTVRLNPELRIRVRDLLNYEINYLKNKNFNLDVIKNRFCNKQYTVNFTFTLNAGKIYPELSFVKTKDICEKINDFNDKFNSQYWAKSYKFGIDRGLIELATVCISKFDKNEIYEYEGKKYLKPTFPKENSDMKVYTLNKNFYNQKLISNLDLRPEDKKTKRRVVANISYFIDKIDDSNWFTKQSCTCVDLTTAKVINGYIISNGDILTFLKLKKEAAKRKLFELVARGIITLENKELRWGSIDEQLADSAILECYPYDKKCNLYYFENKHNRDFEGVLLKNDFVYDKDSLKQNLQEYLDNLLLEKNKSKSLNNKHVPSINKINHLRDSIISNMIGVLFKLYEKYPGIFVLENLTHDTLMDHFGSLNIDISNRFEMALIQKLQTLGVVPPHIKNLLNVRDSQNKEHGFQLGALVYVNDKGTSKNCPYCGKPWHWKFVNDFKFNKRRYVCGENPSCGFDTLSLKDKFKFLSEIDDPDKVAAYNISKRAENYKNQNILDKLKPEKIKKLIK